MTKVGFKRHRNLFGVLTAVAIVVLANYAMVNEVRGGHIPARTVLFDSAVQGLTHTCPGASTCENSPPGSHTEPMSARFSFLGSARGVVAVGRFAASVPLTARYYLEAEVSLTYAQCGNNLNARFCNVWARAALVFAFTVPSSQPVHGHTELFTELDLWDSNYVLAHKQDCHSPPPLIGNDWYPVIFSPGTGNVVEYQWTDLEQGAKLRVLIDWIPFTADAWGHHSTVGSHLYDGTLRFSAVYLVFEKGTGSIDCSAGNDPAESVWAEIAVHRLFAYTAWYSTP